jgi:hypothetical protein
MRPYILRGLVALALLFLPACSCDLLAPPFDATGIYDGAWEGNVSGLDRDYTCAVELDLEHEADGSLEVRYTLSGTLRLNFTCQQTIRELVPLGFPAFLDFRVTGFLDSQGRVIFVAANCDGFDCQGVLLTARGEQIRDGRAGVFEGTFSTRLNLKDGPRTLTGTFTADRIT